MTRVFQVGMGAGMLLVSMGLVRADITNGLIAHYTFEGMTGSAGETVSDLSGRGHDGVCRQNPTTPKAPTVVAGPEGMGEALHFDGSFYVEIPNHADFDLQDELTIAAWCSVDTFDVRWQTLFSRGDWSWRLHRNNTSEAAAFHMSGPSAYGVEGSTNIATPKRWVHVVGTYNDGGGARLYIDGGLEAENGNLSGLVSTNGNDPATIGGQIHQGSLRRLWKGQLDEVRLYDRVLGPADVQALFAFASAGPNFNHTPIVTVPDPQVLTSAPTNLQLVATAEDDGKPLPADTGDPDPNDPNKLRWSWSVVSMPSASTGVVWSGNPTNGEAFTYDGSSNAPGTVFTCDPTATLDVAGQYVFEFTASDGEKSASRQSTVYVQGAPSGAHRDAGYLYLSPVPGASYVSAQTRYVLIRFEEVSPLEVTNLTTTFITVTGASSGAKSGVASVASDGRTVVFEMTQNFSNNELVTVTLNPLLAPGTTGTVDPYEYQFMITAPMPGSLPLAGGSPLVVPADSEPATNNEDPPSDGPQPESFDPNVALIMPNGVSVPSGFPHIDITINDNPDPGYVFIDNRKSGSGSYNAIFDNQGNPIWYLQTDDERRDMKVQRNGLLTMLARDGGMRFIGLDTNYVQVAEYRTVNGYDTDEHELVVQEDGTYFLIGRRNNTVDMSQYVAGGQSSASVRETVIQEFTATGELIFQWRAWDNYDIRNNHLDPPTASSIRFPHMNAIEVDLDGHLLVSCRHQSEVTKLDRNSGDVIWRLNGANSDFTFTNDALNGFFCQHSIRTVGTNRYILFDNGNYHSPSESRGVEYELDLTNGTANVVWEFRDTPLKYAHYMSNVQRLPNGNTLINWAIGGLPKLTEVRPDGTKAFEMNWVDGYQAYRTWRHPWQGAALSPYLFAEPADDSVILVFNQFGDTNISLYRIYGGTEPNPTNVVATSTLTLKRLTNVLNGVVNYFRVTAVSTNGVESGFSNEESLLVNITLPGGNMVVNGDFSEGSTPWTWGVTPPAVATFDVGGGTGHFQISNGGTYLADVQLIQEGMSLTQGKEYTLEFDAWSAVPRIFEGKVEENAVSGINYSGIQPFTATPVVTHKTYTFTMNSPSDNDARVTFNAGASPHDVYVDNVSLVEQVYAPGDFDFDGCVGWKDLEVLTGEWMQEEVGLTPDLNGDGTVDFADFVIFAEGWSGEGACP